MTEEQLIERLNENPIPAQSILNDLQAAVEGDRVQVGAWAQLLQEALAEKKQYTEAIQTLIFKCKYVLPDYRDYDSTHKKYIKEELESILSNDRNYRKLLSDIPFDDRITGAECMRRVLLLLSFKKGTLCHDRTWGTGTVQYVDFFYKRLDIDFERKRGHKLAFAYAAETLEILKDEHFLSVAHRTPEVIQQMIREAQGDLVRLILNSFGPTSVNDLQDILIPRTMKQSQWKAFWEEARKDLKKDHAIIIPTKRQEPITMINPDDQYGNPWFGKLAKERDMKTILGDIESIEKKFSMDELDDEQRNIIRNRIEFVAKGAGKKHLDFLARAAMLAEIHRIEDGPYSYMNLYQKFLNKNLILKILQALPATYMRTLIARLLDYNHADAEPLLISLLDSMDVSTLTECMTALIDRGFESDCMAIFKKDADMKALNTEFLYWIYRNPDITAHWNLPSRNDLAKMTITALEQDATHLKLKAQNQLRELCGREEWLSETLTSMTDAERKEFFLRFKESPAWDSLDRQSVMAKMVKIRPEFEQILVEQMEPDDDVKEQLVTSWRSFYERQQQLTKLVNEDIPKNSQDIAEARAHGDLRENFEYKAAKEMQTILLRRREELEIQLKQVQGSDFEGLPHDKAGMATEVLIAYADGIEEQYVILGEWDRDEALGIISSNSGMAKALVGHQAGETIRVPTENGDRECEIKSVRALSDEIKQWIRG